MWSDVLLYHRTLRQIMTITWISNVVIKIARENRISGTYSSLGRYLLGFPSSLLPETNWAFPCWYHKRSFIRLWTCAQYGKFFQWNLVWTSGLRFWAVYVSCSVLYPTWLLTLQTIGYVWLFHLFLKKDKKEKQQQQKTGLLHELWTVTVYSRILDSSYTARWSDITIIGIRISRIKHFPSCGPWPNTRYVNNKLWYLYSLFLVY